MEKEEIIKGLQDAITDLDEEQVLKLVDEGLAADVAPMEMIMGGLNPGLAVIGDGFAENTRFMADLVIGGDIMTQAVEKLRPSMLAGGGEPKGVMVLGTVEGDSHDIGKNICGAVFMGAGYDVYDIGVDASADKFVEAIKQYNADVVGASAVLSPVKDYLKVINKAMIDAGVRDDVIYAIGGWGMNEGWLKKCGADLFGENAVDGVRKVGMMKEGKLPRFSERK